MKKTKRVKDIDKFILSVCPGKDKDSRILRLLMKCFYVMGARDAVREMK